MLALAKKIAIVTGASSGIGRATARLFAEEDAKLIVSTRRQAACYTRRRDIRRRSRWRRRSTGREGAPGRNLRVRPSDAAHRPCFFGVIWRFRSCRNGLLAETGPGTMMLIRTYVAASVIEGVGTFAAEPIRKDATIWRLDPDFDRLIPMHKYEASPPHLRELLDRYAYPSPDRPGFMVYEVDNGRFMNHSATPNTDFSQYGGATATRDIAAGEEITCDYGEFFEDFERLHLATA